MQTPLRLSWHNVDPSDAVEVHVRREVARLERFSDRITGCTVALEAPSNHHRRSGGKYRVRIEISVPAGKLVVGRDPPKTWTHADLYLAVKAAFREAQRQVDDYFSRLEDRTRERVRPARASVARIFPDEGYGFLLTPDGREIYFHERSVLNGAFARLDPGTEVRFVEEAGDEGPQASTVALARPRNAERAGARRTLQEAARIGGAPEGSRRRGT